jgi:pimeloyl-ACP methyl ester carboxylesterase
MFRTRQTAGILLLTLGALLGRPGAGRAEPPGPRGVVFVAGGIGGLDPLQAWAPLALPWAGVPHEVRVFEWTHGKGRPLRDLQDTPHLLGRARQLAGLVLEVRAREPDRPVYLVGHSAGAGLVLAAAGQLPPASLERVILLSAAVSPGFDLRPALRATRREVVSFNSVLDRFFLDWGTRRFGTVDRVYGPSAGLDGFRTPAGLDGEGRRLYRRLVQVPWKFEMLREGRGGLHHSTTMPVFLACQLAPWLKP